MAKIKRLSDYTNLDDQFVTKCREGMKKFDEFSDRYVDLGKLEAIQQIPLLEQLKREHGAYIYYFGRLFSRIAKHREVGEFLASERKELKSMTVEELIKSGINQTNADKIVYNQPKYKEGLRDIQSIREFLITIYEGYMYHLNIQSRNIHQSLSTLQKELENLKRS